MISRRALLAGATTAVVMPADAMGSVRKPKLPPGRDPGGVAVAIIGGGVDYTDPLIASRLARDGEGDLIGWDFVDNDNRPHAPAEEATVTLRALIDRAPSARFIPVRVPRADPAALLRALGFVLQTPARIALLAESPLQADAIEMVRAVAAGARSVLVIGAANVAAAPTAVNLLVLSDPAACLTAIQIAVRLIDTERIESSEALRQRLLSSPERLRQP
jgi:subtilisin family serine protease